MFWLVRATNGPVLGLLNLLAVEFSCLLTVHRDILGPSTIQLGLRFRVFGSVSDISNLEVYN